MCALFALVFPPLSQPLLEHVHVSSYPRTYGFTPALDRQAGTTHSHTPQSIVHTQRKAKLEISTVKSVQEGVHVRLHCESLLK